MVLIDFIVLQRQLNSLLVSVYEKSRKPSCYTFRNTGR